LGTAAVQADSRYLVANNNLSDIQNASTARTNLGLGTAAVQADSRYLVSTNNLSEINTTARKAAARTNLGLGALSVRDSITPADFPPTVAGTTYTLASKDAPQTVTVRLTLMMFEAVMLVPGSVNMYLEAYKSHSTSSANYAVYFYKNGTIVKS